MERGVKLLVRIILLATFLGLAVIFLKPEYRETARSMLRGDVESSPIWRSNAKYYSEVGYEQDEHETAK